MILNFRIPNKLLLDWNNINFKHTTSCHCICIETDMETYLNVETLTEECLNNMKVFYTGLGLIETDLNVNRKKSILIDYNFYLFNRLVVDLIITPNNIAIPYDVEIITISEYYQKLLDIYINPSYEECEQFILNNDSLLPDLLVNNENY